MSLITCLLLLLVALPPHTATTVRCSIGSDRTAACDPKEGVEVSGEMMGSISSSSGPYLHLGLDHHEMREMCMFFLYR